MFKQYISQVLLNAKTMANALLRKATVVSGTEATDVRNMNFVRLFTCTEQINSRCLCFVTDYGY